MLDQNEHTKNTEPANEGKRPARWLFDIVTIVLAVVAIVFAFIQFGDSRDQIKQAQKTLDQLKDVTMNLGPVAKSVQTRYVGEFPDNMDEITKIIRDSPDGGGLHIMTDFSGYGLYSKNPLYVQYISDLKLVRNKRDVNVKMLVYDRIGTAVALKKQFTPDRYEAEKKTGFREFFKNHPPTPPDYPAFLRRIAELLEQPIQELCSNAVEVRRVHPPRSMSSLCGRTADPKHSSPFGMNLRVIASSHSLRLIRT